jgi:hypothetical protein
MRCHSFLRWLPPRLHGTEIRAHGVFLIEVVVAVLSQVLDDPIADLVRRTINDSSKSKNAKLKPTIWRSEGWKIGRTSFMTI